LGRGSRCIAPRELFHSGGRTRLTCPNRTK
jgi:hypothetical protein